ncbi:hypothetical protein N1851_028020 [Merluccius polli]|uniref:Uncharacterized protein n=1 Tax=Merluccius polli TaxID=89951 RepID=A0AA47NTX5_MERPO|nr:hypothetical protein N1851_028020 [Merluccius polli]
MDNNTNNNNNEVAEEWRSGGQIMQPPDPGSVALNILERSTRDTDEECIAATSLSVLAYCTGLMKKNKKNLKHTNKKQKQKKKKKNKKKKKKRGMGGVQTRLARRHTDKRDFEAADDLPQLHFWCRNPGIMADEARDTEEQQLLDDVEQLVEKSKRKRRTIRSSTTRLLNQIDGEVSKRDPDIGRVREMLAVLSAKEDSLRELDRIAEEQTSLDDVEVEIELAEDYRDRIIGMKTRAHQVIQAHETVSRDDPRPARLSDVSANTAGSQRSNPTVRLPKLMIEKFNGDKSSDVSALRQLYDDCEIQIRSLESLEVVSDTYGGMLCPILLQMLPEDMALEYSRQRGDQDEWKVPDVLKFLQKEVQSRERALQMMRSYNQRENQSAHKTGNKSYSTEKWLESSLDCTAQPETHGSVLKVLGLVWRPVTDDFVFDLRGLLDILKERENTKRESVLQSSARIFDPLGFLTPFTIRIECLF